MSVSHHRKPYKKLPVQTWANQIKTWKLTAPAILLLEAHKPLSFIVSQFLLIGQPTLNLFMSPRLTDDMVQLFSDRDQLEVLIHELQGS